MSDLIQILKNLFKGNASAYGLETKSGPIAIREPLTDDILQDHFAGRKRIGIYPLFEKDLVQWAVIDLDENDKDKAAKVYVACLENNLFPYLEKSKSKGFHNWLFFDEPIPAKDVRKVICKMLAEIGIACELFPKQDSLSSDNGIGNFVYLPLYGRSVQEGRTLFLNAEFVPYENQSEHLLRVHRTKTESILSLANEIPDEPKSQHQKADSPPEGSLDVTKYLIHYNIPFQEKKEPTRKIFQLTKCLWADNHTTGDGKGHAAIIQGNEGRVTYSCFHDHCKSRTWADARKAISSDDSLSQFCQGYSQNKQGRNLIEDLRTWVENAFSKFTTDQIYRDLSITTTKDKAHLRVELHRMVEREILERGSINGTFIKIESRSRNLQIKNEVPVPLPLVLPGNVHQYVATYHKQLLVGAGSSNGGKTAYGLNVAYENRNKFDVWYFTTEMDSDELTLRIHNFGYPIKEWDKVKFSVWESCHSIKPHAFNILDYLEVREGEFWRVGDDLRKIFEKLEDGIALVFIQMDRGKQFGWGGQKTVDKARLYFTLDDNKLTIIKGKNWKGKENPNGKVIPFKLHRGAIFEWGHLDE